MFNERLRPRMLQLTSGYKFNFSCNGSMHKQFSDCRILGAIFSGVLLLTFPNKVSANEQLKSSAIVNVFRAYYSSLKNIAVEYQYQNIPERDAEKYFRARRAITSSKKSLKPINEADLEKLKAYFAPAWNCYLLTDFEKIAFTAWYQSDSVFKCGEHLFDGQFNFFRSESSLQWFVTPGLDAKVPLYSDVVAYPVWSFGFSSLIPFSYADKTLVDLMGVAESSGLLSVSKNQDGKLVIRFVDARDIPTKDNLSAFEVVFEMSSHFKILEISSFVILKKDLGNLEKLTINPEAKITIAFSDHNEISPGLMLPFTVKAKHSVRLADLSDYVPSEKYRFSEVGLPEFNANELLEVNSHVLRVKSFSVNLDVAEKKFRPELKDGARIFNYMTGRYENLDSILYDSPK